MHELVGTFRLQAFVVEFNILHNGGKIVTQHQSRRCPGTVGYMPHDLSEVRQCRSIVPGSLNEDLIKNEVTERLVIYSLGLYYTSQFK